MNAAASPNRPDTALLLMGGGARAAYQVGVLQGIAALHRRHQHGSHGSPFDIIVGTSAGAINAAALACEADHFQTSVTRLAHVWRHFHTAQVYRTDALHSVGAGLRWLGLMSMSWMPGHWGQPQPRALLDNQPLRALLQAQLRLDRLPGLLAAGHLRALAVTTSSYSTGEHITFYDGDADLHDWARPYRRAVRTAIGVEHLMASSAIPFLFPAARVMADGQPGYHGDGSMRQLTPLAPVVHLGAERVLAIGVGHAHEPAEDNAVLDPGYPSLAQVAGHVLTSIFLDTLARDAQRLHRINHTLQAIAPDCRAATGLRAVDLLTITPSRRLDEIAARHGASLPASVRTLLGMLGARDQSPGTRSAALATYLLFEAGYTRELMRLGREDARTHAPAICAFFDWRAP